MTPRPAFGIFPTPATDGLGGLWEALAVAEGEGLDLVGIQDHPYQQRFVDTFSLLAAAAARTERLTLFSDVASLPLRPPAVLAKAAATIDIISGGRFELGLGAGAFWDGIAAMDGPRRPPAEALAALREAIEVIRLMWSGERSVRVDGEHYRLSGVRPGPVPAHGIGIWLGVYGPKALRLLGEAADGWIFSIPSMPVAEILGRQRAIDEAAQAAGRDPARIRRVANVNGSIADGPSTGPFNGPPEQWVDELTALAVEQRVDSFLLWPEGELVDQTSRFAAVAAAVRDALGNGSG